MSSPNPQLLTPVDRHNRQLIAQVHPTDWVNPAPADRYDLVVIGAGTAGLVVAAGAAGLGLRLRIALVEKHLMGGDCLNFGCVPSKTIIRSARIVGEIQRGRELGINTDSLNIDFATVMERMRRIRSEISHHDSAQRFKDLGIDVFFGTGEFKDLDQLAVGNTVLRFKKAIIATGARANIPNVSGIAESGYLTNETVFSLVERPQRLAVIGGGPIGCELAQTFQRLGCEVVILHQGDRLLPKEDPAAAAILQQTLRQEGVQLILGCQLQEIVTDDAGKTIHYLSGGQLGSITVDAILLGAGRQPNVESLNLPQAGVAANHRGVQINDYLQTTNANIYAAGDVCMRWQFTHAADSAARIVIKNTLFAPFGWGRSRLSSLVMPWVTYTDPEIAHVGKSEQDLQGQNFEVIEIPMTGIDRAITDGETAGFVKIIHWQGKILGATIVASHAGEMISEITAAMVHKINLGQLSAVIHPYPTQADGIKKAADAYRRTLLTPRTQKILGILARLSIR